MKRLIPFDSSIPGRRNSRAGIQPGRRETKGAPAGQDAVVPEPRNQQCALPIEPDPRRTAFYAVVSRGYERDEGVLHVQETPLTIVPFRDTEIVHFSSPPAGVFGENVQVSISERTCFDVVRPYALPKPGAPVIVVGIDLGDAIEAEIIADMESEARYRSLILRHQNSRGWNRPEHGESRSSGSV